MVHENMFNVEKHLNDTLHNPQAKGRRFVRVSRTHCRFCCVCEDDRGLPIAEAVADSLVCPDA